jgi:hypothetical protein
MKRRRRHAALMSHGISSAARANAGPAAAAMASSLPATRNPYTCSSKSPVSGLCAVPLPSAQDALTWWCGLIGRRSRPLTRFWPEMASMSTWK